MIQITESTAEHIKAAGKAHWISPRADMINAKGKGILKTFWVNPHAYKAESESNGSASGDNCKEKQNLHESSLFVESEISDVHAKKERLVGWIVEVLQERIQSVVDLRENTDKQQQPSSQDLVYFPTPGETPLDEFTDVITLPKFHEIKNKQDFDDKKYILNDDVKEELRTFASTIAALYHENSFHNFEHACHVTMSVNKLLTRIVTPCLDIDSNEKDVASYLHAYTHGINSDPLTVLAIVFSAVIHDVDHRGTFDCYCFSCIFSIVHYKHSLTLVNLIISKYQRNFKCTTYIRGNKYGSDL